MSGLILTASAADRLRRDLRDKSRRPVNKLPRLERKFRAPPAAPHLCPEVDVINLFGPITGGTVVVRYKLQGVTADTTLQWDTTAAAAQTALVADHPKIDSADVRVVGGPWPVMAIHVIWQGQYSRKTVEIPTIIPDVTGGGTCHAWKASSVNWRGYADVLS